MKILGKSGDEYDKKYICEISHSEIEKFLHLYYNKMDEPKTGDKIDLGDGYDYYSKTKSALEETQKFFKSHADVIRAITDGLLLVGIND